MVWLPSVVNRFFTAVASSPSILPPMSGTLTLQLLLSSNWLPAPLAATPSCPAMSTGAWVIRAVYRPPARCLAGSNGSKCCSRITMNCPGTTGRAIAGRSWAVMMWAKWTSVPPASVERCLSSELRLHDFQKPTRSSQYSWEVSSR